jgi:tetratricopeptide (TPR) repeat protein
MDDPFDRQHGSVGRREELNALSQSLARAIAGEGSSFLISGEPGMGKTHLMNEFRNLAEQKGARVLYGAAQPDSSHPFQLYSSALEGHTESPLFEEQEHQSFAKIFVVNRAGLLLAQSRADADDDMDADIFAGMLSAVQDFVRDSFDSSGGQKTGLGRIEYGDMKILIEHGRSLFLTAVVKGQEHAEMRAALKRCLNSIEMNFGQMLDNWSGRMAEMDGILAEIETAASLKFLVRKELEGLKLDSERYRISDAVLSNLRRMAGGNLLVLLLEDLHWADDSSLFVTAYLARNIDKSNIVIVSTARNAESQTFQRALAKMREGATITELELPPLNPDEMLALIQVLYPGNLFPESFTGTISGKSEGNPFFIREMLWQMQKDGNIEHSADGHRLVTEDYSIPSSIESIVHRRLEGLEPDAMAMIEYASCIGREFRRDLLASMRSAGDAAQTLGKLSSSGILRLLNGHAEFSHALFQEVTYSGIGDRWKRMHHRGIGEYYETAYAGKLEEVLYELAKHFSRAGVPDKGYGYCIKAAEKAEGVFAAEQAIGFYRNALELSGRAGSLPDSAELLGRIGDLYGLVSRFEDSISSYRESMEAETEPRRKAELHKKIADNFLKMSRYDDCSTECAAGLAVLPENDESAERARLLLAMGWCHGKKGDYDDANEFFNRGLELASNLGLKKEMADSLHNLGTMNWYRGDFSLALDNLEKAKAIREELDDILGLANTLTNLGSVHHLRGDLDKAFPIKMRSYELYEKIGEKFGMAVALNNIGISHFHRGDLGTCLEYYNRSLAIRRQIGDLSGITTALHNIGVVHSVKGDSQAAIGHFDEGLSINRRIGSKPGMLYDLCSLAEEHVTAGDNAESMKNAEEALQMSSDIGALAEEGWVRRIIGKNHMAAGDFGEAMKQMVRSLEIAEETEEKEEILKSYHDLGLLFKQMGDGAKAREHLERSMSIAKEIDDALLKSMVQKDLDEL